MGNEQALYTFPQSVGIAGGRPSSSYYFVGSQADNLFYLDPHHARPAIPLRLPPPSDVDSMDRRQHHQHRQPRSPTSTRHHHHHHQRVPTSPSSRTSASTASSS